MERKSNAEFKEELEERTVAFATLTFRYLDSLPRSVSTRVISYQLGKSASSVGANYREANRAESVDDFIHKISIATKEANETVYWYNILNRLYVNDPKVKDLMDEAVRLSHLFQTIRQSSKKAIPRPHNPPAD